MEGENTHEVPAPVVGLHRAGGEVESMSLIRYVVATSFLEGISVLLVFFTSGRFTRPQHL